MMDRREPGSGFSRIFGELSHREAGVFVSPATGATPAAQDQCVTVRSSPGVCAYEGRCEYLVRARLGKRFRHGALFAIHAQLTALPMQLRHHEEERADAVRRRQQRLDAPRLTNVDGVEYRTKSALNV